MHLWEIQPIRDLLVIGAVFGILYLGFLISIVTVPLLLALLLAYLLEPVVVRITREGRVRRSVAAGGLIGAVAVVLVIPAAIGLAVGIVSAVGFAQDVTNNAVRLGNVLDARTEGEREAALDALPKDFWRWFARTLDGREWGETVEGAELGDAPRPAPPDAPADTQEATSDRTLDPQDDDSRVPPSPSRVMLASIVDDAVAWAKEYRGRIASTAARSGLSLLGATVHWLTTLGVLIFGAFLTAFFFFFISTGYAKVIDFGKRLVPDVHRDRTVDLLRQMDKVIAGFIRGRLTIALIQSIVFSIGYFLIGTPAALLVGIAVGILSIVPYLALIGIPISMALMFLDPADGFRGAWWWILTAPVAWYFLGQALDDYVWTPKIQGEATGLDTPTVLFASIAGGALAGFYGLLIAIPIAACIKILLREVLWPKFKEWVEGRAKDPLPLGSGKGDDD